MKYLILLLVLCAIGLYHTGIKSEQDCLELGNSKEQCAALSM